MTLDIEHFQKVTLLREMEDRGEDGYAIVADYMASLTTCLLYTSKQESVGASNVDIVFTRCMKAIDRFFEPNASLHLINHHNVIEALAIAFLNVAMQCSIIR